MPMSGIRVDNTDIQNTLFYKRMEGYARVGVA